MAGTTYASRPASNLITKCLFPHPSAGAYSALPIKREWDVLPCTVPLSFFCPVPPPHPGLSRNFWLQYTPNLAPAIKKFPERTVCVQSRSFSMAGTTFISRPASNLITKCLFPHPSAGAYSTLPIKRGWDVLPCTVPFSFFYPVPPMHPGLPQI